MRWIKIKDLSTATEPIYPEPHWLPLGAEEEKGKVNDDDIYHYLPQKELDSINEGDIIELDESFVVVKCDDVWSVEE